MQQAVLVIFTIGYILIALEHPININKTATALATGALCWALIALDHSHTWLPFSDHYAEFASHHAESSHQDNTPIYNQFVLSELSHYLGEIASIVFFLMGAMTIVELIDIHGGFSIITSKIKTRDIRSLLWIVSLVAFFLSSVLDNLTTAIVMVSLVRKLVPHRELRMTFAGMIIIAANAGGAWSPIGDVTTTMLWIDGQITSMMIMKEVILPSVVCLLLPLMAVSLRYKGRLEGFEQIHERTNTNTKQGNTMLAIGVGALVSVPIFKSLTHLPPFMGILLGLGAMWVISEFINPELDDQERKQYTAAGALSRIDSSSVMFFFGILLSVSALETMGILSQLARSLEAGLGNQQLIISLIGVISAIVDNVPLVAACMGMYPMEIYPPDHQLWHFLAYCAGTGGSLLIIGSAAGVAVMGMEKIDFLWYLRKISLLALLGYAGGAVVYLLLK